MATKVKKAPIKPKMKSYVSDFTISLGALSWSGSLVGVRDTDQGPKFKLISPDGNSVKQYYLDEITQKYFLPGELHKSFIQGDEQTTMTQDVVKAIGESEKPKNILPVTVHSAAEVDEYLYPADSNGYVFVPNIKVPELQRIFNALLVVLDTENKTLVGICNLQNHEGLFRLSVWRGQLVLQKQCYPADIREHTIDVITIVDTKDETWTPYHVLGADVAAVTKMFTKQSQPFDPETYKNEIAAKQFALLADPDSIVLTDEKPEADISDFLASLEAMS